MGYWAEGKWHEDDEPNAAPGYQDPMFPQRDTEIVPADQLKKNPALPVKPVAPAPTTPANDVAAPPANDTTPEPEVPTKTTTYTDSSYTRTREVVSPEEKAKLAELRGIDDAEKGVVERQGQLADKEAQVKEVQAQEEAARKQLKAARIAEELRRGEEESKAAQLETAQAIEERKRAASAAGRTWWDDAPTANRVAMGISLALGALGASKSAAAGQSSENKAMAVFDRIVAQDAVRKKDKYGRAQDAVGEARLREKDVIQAQDRRLAQTELLEAAGYEAIKAQYAAMLARMGRTAEQIKTDATYIALDRRAAEREQKAMAETRDKVVSSTQKRVAEVVGGGGENGQGGRYTDGQRKAQANLERMVPENEVLNKQPLSKAARQLLWEKYALDELMRKNPGVDYTSRVTRLQKAITEKLSDSDRRAYYAADRWIEPFIRDDSGAVISEAERARRFETYIPHVGDKGQDIDDKRRARDTAQRAMATKGFGTKAYDDQVSKLRGNEAPAPKAASNQPRRGSVNGKPALIYPDGTYELVK